MRSECLHEHEFWRRVRRDFGQRARRRGEFGAHRERVERLVRYLGKPSSTDG